MSGDENTVFIDADKLMHGELLHSCGGIIRATWYTEGTIASIRCGGCDSFVTFDNDGTCTEVKGDPLDLANRVTPQEGNA
jgi:hypothetical protein